jgi:hypothetical protein
MDFDLAIHIVPRHIMWAPLSKSLTFDSGLMYHIFGSHHLKRLSFVFKKLSVE